MGSDVSVNGGVVDGNGCALVTGAGRGIGAAIAMALAAEGWPIAVNYSADSDGAAAVVERIVENGGRALAVKADVADPEAVDSMFDKVEQELGPVHVLVNNAGIRNDRLLTGLDVDKWSRVIDVNLSGTFHTIKRALRAMARQRFGRIVNISSISAQRPLAGQSAYSASKAGVEALTRALSLEVARRGITINAIAPGLVATGFVPEMTEEYADAMPAKRVADPEEIANCVRFLVSSEAGYVNGAVLTVDGAMTAGLGVFRQPSRPEAATSTVGG
jgi:3-oxoacyl-[acyl-carrier protein] reductase